MTESVAVFPLDKDGNEQPPILVRASTGGTLVTDLPAMPYGAKLSVPQQPRPPAPIEIEHGELGRCEHCPEYVFNEDDQ
jgi:hypothetical protein